jgi:virginiamycin B lyase
MLIACPLISSAQVNFSEYAIPTASSAPQGITVGPDGAMWFAESSSGNSAIGRIDISGVISQYPVDAGSQPQQIVTGPDGNLYFTVANGNFIGQMTTSGVLTKFAIPNLGGQTASPTGITVGHEGYIWFAMAGPSVNSIAAMDTTGNFSVVPPIQIATTDSVPVVLTVGPDNNIWFTEVLGNKIGTVRPTGSSPAYAITEYSVPTASSEPFGIVSGPNGNLWFTERNSGKIASITTSGVITEYSLPSGSAQPFEITVGADGALWFAEEAGNNIGRITTSGAITEYAIPTSGSGPYGIAQGADHAIWFTEDMGDKIGHLTSASFTPVADLLFQKDNTRNLTVWFMGGSEGTEYLGQAYIGATPGWSLHGFADMNQDGVPDLLFQNDSTGDITVWFMGGPQGATYMGQAYIGATPGWTLRGAADMNRDGVPDLLFQNDTTRDMTVWFMGGSQGAVYQSQAYIGATPGWSLRTAADMNQDGVPDLLFQNDSTGDMTVWFMGGSQGAVYQSQAYIGATPGWTLRRAVDLNADGVPDLLFQNDASREMTVWFMTGSQGTTYSAQAVIGQTTGYTLFGTGNTSLGSIPHLLFQANSTRNVTVWYMGGPQGTVYNGQSALGSTPGYSLRATADMNGDGVRDLLFQNDSTREVTVWYMGGPQGTTYVSQASIGATPGWTLRGAADMNQDGVPDLLFQNDTSRDVTVWFMGGSQGAVYQSQVFVGTTPGYTLAATGDMNQDGVPDLLFQNDSTREVTVWFMGGSQGAVYQSQGAIGAAQGWTVRTALDMNQDGVPDLLWQNDSNQEMTVWFMGGSQGLQMLSQTVLGSSPGYSLAHN